MSHRFFSLFFRFGCALLALTGGCGGGGNSHNAVPTLTATPAPILSATPRPTPTPTPRPTPTGPVHRLACVGDSITAGVGVANGVTDAYPAVLARSLGHDYQVNNFGVSGSTLLNNSSAFYQAQPSFGQAVRFKPDILTVALGTNDSRYNFDTATQNRFLSDYQTLIRAFKTANPQVKVYLCLPVPSYPMDGSMNQTLSTQILPLIRRAARDSGAQIIDLYTPLSDKPQWFADSLHPNTAGAKVIAEEIYRALISP